MEDRVKGYNSAVCNNWVIIVCCFIFRAKDGKDGDGVGVCRCSRFYVLGPVNIFLFAYNLIQYMWSRVDSVVGNG